jgi:hypothetical protein
MRRALIDEQARSERIWRQRHTTPCLEVLATIRAACGEWAGDETQRARKQDKPAFSAG